MAAPSHCTECGMFLHDPGEFHPQAFCIWKKAGQDPWALLLWVNEGLGLDVSHWPEHPPPLRKSADPTGRPGVPGDQRQAPGSTS